VLAALVAASTVAFFFWGEPLWRVAPGTSHVARIAGSYLIAVPLAAVVLAVARRLTLQHLLGSIAVVWSAKLVITATSYALVAPGSATEYAPARTWDTSDAAAASNRKPPATPRMVGTAAVTGRVVESGAPVAGVVVVIGDLEGEAEDDAAGDVALTIDRSQYDRAAYLVSPRDRMRVTNRDNTLHTIRLLRNQHAVANHPIPASSGPYSVAAPPPGIYEMSCENHAAEQALLVVADRHRGAMTDADGRFELRGLSAGEHDVSFLRAGRDPIVHKTQLSPGRISALSIELR
jgi:plastocyanin